MLMNPHNFVDAVVHCPTCGQKIDVLYTEDASLETLRHETVPLQAIRCFYGQCGQCDTWLDFERRDGLPGDRPSDFILTWDPDRERTVSRRRFFGRFFKP